MAVCKSCGKEEKHYKETFYMGRDICQSCYEEDKRKKIAECRKGCISPDMPCPAYIAVCGMFEKCAYHNTYPRKFYF